MAGRRLSIGASTSLALSLSVYLSAVPAFAQMTSLGVTNSGPAQNGTVSSVAYDDKHDVFLHVWEDAGAVRGRFINFDGAPAGAAFTVASAGAAPKVVYTHGTADDLFLVLFSGPSGFQVQLLRDGGGAAAAGLVGGPVLVGGSVHAVEFSPTARRFVILRATIQGTTVLEYTPDLTAGPSITLGGGFPATTGGRLAVNWQASRLSADVDKTAPSVCSMIYVGYWTVDESAGSAGVFTTLTDNNVGARVPFQVAPTFLPEAGDSMHVWTEQIKTDGCPGRGTTLQYRVVGRLGASSLTVLDTGQNDLNPSMAYDAICRCVLVVAEGGPAGASTTAQYMDAILLAGDGQPSGSPFRLAATTTTGSFRPIVRASRGGQFVISYVTDAGAILERVSLPAAASPGPRFSSTIAHLDGPASGTVGRTFGVGGWALDLGGSVPDGTGIDAVHAWAFPTNGGAPQFLGEDHTFHDRSDVGGVYGSHFTHSGFDIYPQNVPLGTYDVAVYAHSSVSGTFVRGDVVRITVAAQPRMNLEAPGPGNVSVPFVLGGWAIDAGAGTNGPGIDTIHVWAFPANGSSPIFLGTPEYLRPRDDVAAVFGSSYRASGFRMDVATLAPGAYRLVAYPHSSVTGDFSNQQGVDVTVTAPVPQPAMSLDAPAAPNLTVDPPFRIQGWAVDRGALSGCGVDVVHVWAFPAGGGGGIFIREIPVTGHRPDVAAVFGAQFLFCGFGPYSASGLAPGDYQLVAYAHSTVAGAFSVSKSAAVRVRGPLAVVLNGSIDSPAQMQGGTPINQQPFLVSGWAIDRNAIGVDPGLIAVRIRAYRTVDNVFTGFDVILGTADYGAPRQDLAALYGPRFLNCGFSLMASGLSPGTYFVYIEGLPTGSSQYRELANPLQIVVN